MKKDLEIIINIINFIQTIIIIKYFKCLFNQLNFHFAITMEITAVTMITNCLIKVAIIIKFNSFLLFFNMLLWD